MRRLRFQIHGTSREQILRTYSGGGTFGSTKIASKSLKSLAHPTEFESLTSALGGQGLPIIGKLPEQSQAQTTARYAHLADDPAIEVALSPWLTV